MRRILVVAACLGVALMTMECGSNSANPDSNGATIKVTATHDGQPFDDAIVVVSASADLDSVVAMGMTNANGLCILSGLEPGMFTVTISRGAKGQMVYDQISEIDLSSGGEFVQAIVVDQVLSDLLPLALNNRWDMISGDDSVASLGVFSTKWIDGMLTYAFGPEVGGHPGYFSRGGLIVYDHGYEQPYGGDFIRARPVVWVDFGNAIGTRRPVPNWGFTEIMEKDTTVIVPAGTFTNCLHVGLTGTVEGGIWFAPGVGVVRVDRNGVILELTAYELH